MESKKSTLAGSLIASAILGLSNLGANASTLTAYAALGSGAEVRSELLNISVSNVNGFELKCGSNGDTTKAAQGKTKEHKCGEGHDHKKEAKTGEQKKDAKEAKPADNHNHDHKKDEKSPK